jgi:hypothetical protein
VKVGNYKTFFQIKVRQSYLQRFNVEKEQFFVNIRQKAIIHTNLIDWLMWNLAITLGGEGIEDFVITVL